ncbi:hypothetical protein SAMN05216428_10183 [Nitrosospira sp. Nsp11]|uniref:hypothetical protein n=1 Tax=Nitrosospira sp. Nsp11 TaxID=1855338 RepID=UPI0009111AEE|nr:hypothetical protein [Nitrosospira sp. Nsp11]SHL10405.1 hypothetical protein SAMN05216428_10183 [Nitrosospira sp. Nsp11]
MAIGFGSTLGVGAGDRIIGPAEGIPTKVSIHVWTNRNGDGGGGFGRVFGRGTGVFDLFNNHGQIANTYGFGTGAPLTYWSWTRPPLSTWAPIGISVDTSVDISGGPAVYQSGTKLTKDSGLSFTTFGGGYGTSATPWCVGNRPSDNARAWDGSLAEFAVWNVILTDAEFAALQRGASPELIRPDARIHYLPAERDGWLNKSGTRWTVTGTKSPLPHPAVRRPGSITRLWAVSSGGATHDLTAASTTQANVASTSATGAITQTHIVAVQTSAQPNTATAGAISQSHLLAGASSSQANTGTAGAVSQTHALSAAGSVQTNVASTGAIAVGETHDLAAAAATQANIGTPGAISQVHALVGVGGTQTNTGASAAVSQAHVLGAAGSTQANAASVGAVTVGVVHDLAASPSTQTNAGASGAVSQAHILVCPPSVQDNIAAASTIVQTHILMGASSTQPNAASTGAIEQHSGIPPVDGPAGSGPRLRVPHGHRPAMRNTSRPRQLR